MKPTIKKRHLFIIAIFFALNIGTAKAEDKNEKIWTVDVQEDYHSTAELTGRFMLKEGELLSPYLLTGGNLNWDSQPKPDSKELSVLHCEIGFSLGAGFCWEVSRGVSFYAEPFLKYTVFEKNLNSAIGKTPGEKIIDENLRVGLRYGF